MQSLTSLKSAASLYTWKTNSEQTSSENDFNVIGKAFTGKPRLGFHLNLIFACAFAPAASRWRWKSSNCCRKQLLASPCYS